MMIWHGELYHSTALLDNLIKKYKLIPYVDYWDDNNPSWLGFKSDIEKFFYVRIYFGMLMSQYFH